MSVTLHTDFGDVKIELYVEEVPMTCENFLAHCAQGTYDNTKILKIIPDFIIQFGDPTNTGKGGESIWGGYFEDELSRGSGHKRGTVSMANNGKPNTNGSQFFICLNQKAPVLDGKYTIFGEVTLGIDVLDRMQREIKTKAKNNKPLENYYIKTVTIHANPIADSTTI